MPCCGTYTQEYVGGGGVALVATVAEGTEGEGRGLGGLGGAPVGTVHGHRVTYNNNTTTIIH